MASNTQIRGRFATTLSLVLLYLALVAGCASQFDRLNQSDADLERPSRDKVIEAVTATMVDKGFDVKLVNKEGGLITSEWRRTGGPVTMTAGGNEYSYEYFMQLRVKVTEKDGRVKVSVIPAGRITNFGKFSGEGYLAWPKTASQKQESSSLTWKEIVEYRAFLDALAENLGTDQSVFSHNITKIE